MRRRIRTITFTFKDWLTLFSGEDFAILKKCDRAFQNRFAWVGFFVLMIFVGCFVSSAYAVYSFFNHNLWLSIPIGAFFGWMIVNIYLLLLYTLTPNLLVDSKDQRLAYLSFTFRVLFIGLLAVIIAKPISVYALDSLLKRDVDHYQTELYNRSISKTDSMLVQQERAFEQQYLRDIRFQSNTLYAQNNPLAVLQGKIHRDVQYLTTIQAINKQLVGLKNDSIKDNALIIATENQLQSAISEQELDNIQILSLHNEQKLLSNNIETLNNVSRQFYFNVISVIEQRQQSRAQLRHMLAQTSFFIFKIKTVASKYPLSWIIDVAIVLIFLLPVYWKTIERKLTRYYSVRRRIEKNIVLDEYDAFKFHYTKAMEARTGKKIEFYEPFSDPPFNTKRKSNSKELKPQKDFLNKIYGVS